MNETYSFPAEWLPAPEDELLHVPFGDESLPWKETFYISVRDDASNANISMHMTVSANRTPKTRCAVSVLQGSNSTIQVVRSEGTQNDQRIGNELSWLEMVNLSWDSRHEVRWIGKLDEVEFDLTLKGQHLSTLWDTMFKGFFATGKTGQVYCHAEQIVTATGFLRWKGSKEVPFSGFGWRDRGWGRRKTELMWNTGWDLVAGILPDGSAFSCTALRSHEIPEPAPMPVAGWWTDGTSLSPLVSGEYHKEATACPKHIALEFANGRRVVGDVVRPTGRVAVAMQESEFGPGASIIAATMQDYYAILADPAGQQFSVFSQNGYVHKVDVFRGAQFVHAGSPPRTHD
jgi:hypothetical protein